MDPSTVYHLGHVRLAELHRQAERDALVRAARRARRHQSGHRAPGLLAVVARWSRRLGLAAQSSF
jgi:hypothetical protein